MGEKRKISIRKIIQVLLTLVVTTACVVAMVSAARIEGTKTLSSVAVHIRNDKKYHFIEQKEIMDLAINNRNIDVAHTPISKLDLHSMEQVILADPWISDAQVYVDNDRVLQMYVTQRLPVARLFVQNNRSYYIDTTLSLMPLSPNNIYYTTVVTNVPELKNDSTGWALRARIVKLARKIQADSFWNAQISQVIIDSDAMFELIPVLGDQRILFGDATAMTDKFNNLFIFYKQVLNRIGWDKYETLDVRFNGQVIALPSLPYSGPEDKAVDKLKMNWITNMVEMEAANDVSDSLRAEEEKADHASAIKKREKAAQMAKTALQAKNAKKPVAKIAAQKGSKRPVAKAAAKKDNKKPGNKKQPTKPGKKDKDRQQKQITGDKSKAKNNSGDKKKTTSKYVYPGK